MQLPQADASRGRTEAAESSRSVRTRTRLSTASAKAPSAGVRVDGGWLNSWSIVDWVIGRNEAENLPCFNMRSGACPLAYSVSARTHLLVLFCLNECSPPVEKTCW
eukprot:361745-Chlamydomonas_euryale.AAC.3